MLSFNKRWLEQGITILLLLFPSFILAGTATNIPLVTPVYRDLERLEVKGLLNSAILSTRPLNRLEAVRLLREAEANLGRKPERARGAEGIIQRLRNEFSEELIDVGVKTYIKPVDKAYIRLLYSDENPYFLNVNNNGDSFLKNGNLRAGLSTRSSFLDLFSIFISPEYRIDDVNSGEEFLYGYIILNLGNLELLVGRDSMWWGSGYHGGLLMTNNAKPFDMIKVSSQRPFLLPWVFNYLGLFKPTVFLTRLEDKRGVPEARLLGMRLDFKPTPHFQFGLSRVFMFSGEGRDRLTLSDWVDVFFASDSAEHSPNPIDGNQIVSIDASYVYINKIGIIPFSGIKLYTEWGAEDSSGKTKSPTGRANIYGMFVDEPFWIDDVDLRLEWANTARNARYGPSWYTHGVYTSGYTYKGNVIGHHMGSDARDLFFRLQYRAEPHLVAGVEVDIERSGIHGNKAKKKWLGLDLTYRLNESITLDGGWGMEDMDDPANPQNDKNNTMWFKTTLNF